MMIKRILLVSLGVVIPLLFVEFLLRQFGPLFDPAAANPWLGCVGWAGRPHQVQENYTDEFTTVEVINSAGLPDVEHTYTKPNNVFRILIIGDSFVEGYFVNLEDSFPRLLEARLNDNRGPDGPRFEVIKAGYRSWGTDQAWLYYQCEGYKYNADLVLYAFTVNDVYDNYLPLKAKLANWSEAAPPKPYYTLSNGQLERHNFPYPPSPPEVEPASMYDYLYKYSIAFRVAKRGGESLRLKIEERLFTTPPSEREITENRYPRWPLQFSIPVYQNPGSAEYEAAWQLTEALLAAFIQEVQAKGSVVAVFSNSMSISAHPDIRKILAESDPLFANESVDWSQPDRRLVEILNPAQIPFLPLDPAFQKWSQENEPEHLFFREGHYNELGNTLTAETLYEWLKTEKLIP